MRLINAHTLKFEEFWNENVKEYAILSHRWEGDEVSFQDMQNLAVASHMKGFAKILKSCEHATIDGYSYVWVDTCCINRESSSELTEAINSMYRWYKASAVCYAFLSDVYANGFKVNSVEQQIKSSVWFTRGWTLQELLAPQRVVFYDRQWEFLGTKQTLSKILALQTQIDEATLRGESLSRCSVAQRMSWASQRVTTRIEDTAYCLLGIFDVNMTVLYGEGEKAFFRLQEEIIKGSDDHTIFAWPIHRDDQPGLLADSPAAFASCHQVRSITSRKGRSPYSWTNRGLSIKLMATQFTVDTYVVCLDCTEGPLPADHESLDAPRLGMFLRRLNENDQYARVKHEGETFMQLPLRTWDHDTWNFFGSMLLDQQIGVEVKQIQFNVQQRVADLRTNSYKDRVNGFRITAPELLKRLSLGKDRFRVLASKWNRQEGIMSMEPREFNMGCTLDFGQQDYVLKLIRLSFDFDYNPVCFVATAEGLSERTKPKLDGQRTQRKKKKTTQSRGVPQRPLSDMMEWSEVFFGQAFELRSHKGLWALKGDRINGLDVQIGNLIDLRIERAEFQDKLVWDVYLDHVQ